jgi:3-oxoacyl-[acyl-carrier protein] reductase
MVDKKTVMLIIGSDAGIGASIAERFRSRGDAVIGIGADSTDLTEADAVRSAIVADAAGRPIDRVVLAWLDPTSFSSVAITDMDEAAWERAAERSLRAAFVDLQQVHAVVVDGARVVLVLPTAAVTGIAGLVPLCTAVEGIRVMAKAIARRWGARSITVNTVEVELSAFVLGDDPDSDVVVPTVPVLGASALPAGSAVDDVVGVIDMLFSAPAAAVTGALLVADRGTVMLP